MLRFNHSWQYALRSFFAARSVPQMANAIVIPAAGTVILIGGLVLLGWVFDVDWFKHGFVTSAATMKANTAIALIAAGVSLWLLQPQQLYPRRRNLGRIAACVVVAIALLTLSEYGFGWDLGIDQLLFPAEMSAASFYPGRMGVNTAINFVLISAALLLLSQQTRRRFWAAQILTLLATLIALQAAIGYIYSVRVFYQFSSYTTSMAPHTALSFVLLGIGILCARPEQGWMRSLTSNLNGGLVARRMLVAAIVLPMLLGWLSVKGYQADRYDPAFGMTLLVMGMVVVFTGLICHSATLLNCWDQKQRQAEAILQDQADLLELAYEAIVVRDAQSAIVYWNRGAEELYGWKKAEAAGNISHRFLQTQFPHSCPDIDALLIQQGRWEGKLVHTRRDGVPITVESRQVLMRNPQGQVKGFLEVNRDITTDQQREANRQRAEAERDRFFKLSLDLLAIGTFDGYFSDLNPAWVKTLGYSLDELKAHTFIDFVHPDDREATQAAMIRLLAGQELTAFENRYRCQDGSYRWMDWVAMPVVEEQLVYAIAHDVTDRKQSQEEIVQLNQSLDRQIKDLETLLEVIPIGIGIADDPDCQQIRVNPNFAKQLGISSETNASLSAPEAERPTNFKVYQNGVELAADDLPMQYAIAHRTEVLDIEVDIVHADGKTVRLLEYAAPLFDERGQVRGCVGAFLNITERVRMEAEVRQLNEELEARVEQRTAQLEAANRELESFSYSVSHDLRAPIRHIAGFISLLQEHLEPTDLDETSQHYIDIIVETTRNAGVLIDDLLSFSRMGRLEMHHITIQLEELVQSVRRNLEVAVSELNPQGCDRQIHWKIDPLPAVQGDPSMLRQALRNLLENAVKYTRTRAEAEIAVGSSSTDQEVVVFIRDNGIGFDNRYHHKLFGVFQRLHSDPQFEGTGVGLANVQRIIHRHGGRVWAEGEQGRGATFYFSLPKQRSGI